MSDSLWESEQSPDWPIHACSGDICDVCSYERQKRGMEAAAYLAEDWTLDANRWFYRLPKGATFTSEDCTTEIGLPTGGVGSNKNNAVGAWVRALSQSKLVKRVDIRSSRRVSSHGAALVVWQKL